MSNLSAQIEYNKKQQLKAENYFPLNLGLAKTLSTNSWIYHRTLENADGTPQRFRVISIKTWKTRPNEIVLSVKRGLKEFHKINQDELKYYMVENR